ncbi:Ig-like domain-containing protein [Acetivibrio saccincola]|uniref:Outer cell wall protein n=2 Tax=Acetivibrio saccincola TaxID=1677857 RepID=A0A2K9EBE6_9FIRM|nr:Ig-like domain-containing protein [Acetivibrio saccincola]AUG59086.1 Outer cell wall protein precursor [Acetivibrio saccincola]
MKNLKKLVALFVAIAMISTLMVPAFADSSFKYEEEARDMYDLGLFKGESETEYVPNLGELLSRETGAVMLLRIFAQEDEALEMSDEEADEKLAAFSDGDTVANWAKKQVAYATDKGYIKGYPDGTFAPKEALNGKAYCSLVLQLLGYDGDFNYHTAATSLSEVGGLTSAEAAIFNSNDPINRDSLVGISYGALKATFKGSNETLIQRLVRLEKVDANLAKDKGLVDAVIKEVAELEDVYVKVGETANLPSTVEVTYDNDETGEVEVTWPTVDTSEVGEQEIEGIIAGTPLTAKVKVIVQPDELTVTSVTADNLKEVAVEFSAALDEDTVNADNIYVKDVTGSVELQEDGRTVIITVDGDDGGDDGLDNSGEYTLVVKNVKDTTGMEIEETEIDFEAFDGTRPEAEEIKVTGPSNLEITFSEPIKEGDGDDIELKIGDTTIGAEVDEGYGTRTLSVSVWDELEDGKTYEVTVKGFKDYAGYTNVTKTFELEYVKDNEPPVAEITKVDQKYIKVEFNKPVTGLHPQNFYHTFTAWEATGIYKDEARTDEIKPENSVSTVWVYFMDDEDDKNSKPLAEGTQKVGIRGKYDDVDVVDNWGNKFETVEIEVTVTVDKEAPEVTSITVESEDKIKVTFNKVVNFSEDNIEVLDTDGKEIASVSSIDPAEEAAKEFTVKLSEPVEGKTIIVKIANVEDTALEPNKLSEYKATIEVGDQTAPSVKVAKDEAGEALYFIFNEDVSNTALDKNNYAIMDDSNGKLTNFKNSPKFAEGSRIVKIELANDENLTGKKIFVQKIEDKAGNAMAGVIVEYSGIDTLDNAVAPNVESVEITAKDKIVITFDQYLKEAPIDGFVVTVDSETFDKKADYKSTSVTRNSKGNTVVTLVLKSADIKADASNVTVQVLDNKLKNRLDVAVKGVIFNPAADDELPGQKYVADKIAPSIKEKEEEDVLDVTATAGKNTIKIEFTEDINDNALSSKTFKVDGYTVESVEASGSTVTITLTDNIEAGKVKITQAQPVEDMAGNEYTHKGTITITVTESDD